MFSNLSRYDELYYYVNDWYSQAKKTKYGRTIVLLPDLFVEFQKYIGGVDKVVDFIYFCHILNELNLIYNYKLMEPIYVNLTKKQHNIHSFWFDQLKYFDHSSIDLSINKLVSIFNSTKNITHKELFIVNKMIKNSEFRPKFKQIDNYLLLLQKIDKIESINKEILKKMCFNKNKHKK